MKTALSFSLISILSFALGACGGSVHTDTTDAGDDVGSDGATSDTGGDAPTVRVPKHHRASALACTPSTGTGSTACSMAGGACKSDSDCTAGKNGHCSFSGGGVFFCSCNYDTCASDSECSTGGPCACQGSPYQTVSNGCAPSGNCKVDGDCGAKGYCSPSGGGGCSNSLSGYFCHTSSDECVDDEDCNTPTEGPGVCSFDSTKKHWACTMLALCD